jgi:hypothetical protein
VEGIFYLRRNVYTSPSLHKSETCSTIDVAYTMQDANQVHPLFHLLCQCPSQSYLLQPGALTDASLLCPLRVQHFGRPRGGGVNTSGRSCRFGSLVLPMGERLSLRLNMHLTTTHASLQDHQTEDYRMYEPESLVQTDSAVGCRWRVADRER